jgi:hypothetical protein
MRSVDDDGAVVDVVLDVVVVEVVLEVVLDVVLGDVVDVVVADVPCGNFRWAELGWVDATTSPREARTVTDRITIGRFTRGLSVMR